MWGGQGPESVPTSTTVQCCLSALYLYSIWKRTSRCAIVDSHPENPIVSTLCSLNRPCKLTISYGVMKYSLLNRIKSCSTIRWGGRISPLHSKHKEFWPSYKPLARSLSSGEPTKHPLSSKSPCVVHVLQVWHLGPVSRLLLMNSFSNWIHNKSSSSISFLHQCIFNIRLCFWKALKPNPPLALLTIVLSQETRAFFFFPPTLFLHKKVLLASSNLLYPVEFKDKHKVINWYGSYHMSQQHSSTNEQEAPVHPMAQLLSYLSQQEIHLLCRLHVKPNQAAQVHSNFMSL